MSYWQGWRKLHGRVSLAESSDDDNEINMQKLDV